MGIMRRKKKQPIGELRLDSTADIAFLLLIFFIVTTIFAAEKGLTLVLPGKQKNSSDVVRVKESNLASIYVDETNQITLDRTPVEVNHIKRMIEDRLGANPGLVVLLKIHPKADYGKMVACLDELRLAKATKISLKTAQE
jgi:biopolymer transport protein ExbD